MATSKAEYLKRYLTAESDNGNDGQKKKKRRKKVPNSKTATSGFRIVDEDLDLSKIQSGDNGMADEEPTIAEVIDERPEAVKQMEEYKATNKWKKLETEQSQRDDSDNSPPRRQRSDSDNSPPRRQRNDSDNSPPRRQRYDSDNSPPRRRRSDSDNSPPRRQRHDSDNSPPRRQRHDSDNSPPRRQRHDSDNSPPRRQRDDSDNSPPRRQRHDSDNSPPRRQRHGSDNSPPEYSHSKHSGDAKKTLSGKVAGLSSAKNMKVEAEKLKLKEIEMFNKIGDKRLGKGAGTVFRDKKTGKKRDLASEKEHDDAKSAEWKGKYDKWAKGIAQGAAEKERIAEMAHEMNKPLARTRDDADLDEYLKNQLHEEDPMLAFIKKKKESKSKGPKYPQYKGPAPEPNRYGIRPGYRWDGVDRGNGFERKYFQSISKRKAVASEAYKWSTEDM